MRKNISLHLAPRDLALIDQSRGNQSLAGFLVRCAVQVASQHSYQIHYAPDAHERNKAAILRFLHNGCATVEDIKYEQFSLSKFEIEAYLFELEQLGKVRVEKAKGGRSWRYEVIEK